MALADSSSLALAAIRSLATLNEQAAAAGATDGGAAPAKLTALKLADKLGSQLRVGAAKLRREALEHLVVRLCI